MEHDDIKRNISREQNEEIQKRRNLEKLLKPQLSPKYYGRVVAEIGETTINPNDEKLGYKKLKQIPLMIKASLYAKLIKSVWASTCYKRGFQGNYYIIETVDGLFYIIS